MRTQKEILKRIRMIKKSDWMGTQQSDLIGYLSFENAKPYLRDGVKRSDWSDLSESDDDTMKDMIISEILNYMEFAWDKANDCRGISANRSLDHMKAWLWLLGYDHIDLDEYTHYGKPQLRAICEHFGWDWKKWDDGKWRSQEFDQAEKPKNIEAVILNWN